MEKLKKKDTSKQIELTSPKKEKTNVVVDAEGVANILITTNDIMKFSIKKMTVKAGQKVKLTLTHTGKLDKNVMGHNVVILKQGVNLTAFGNKAATAAANGYIPKGTTDVIAHTKMIGGGETAVIEFDAPAPGTYDFLCSFPGHYALMKGKFIVE